jgi:hypothetical protein
MRVQFTMEGGIAYFPGLSQPVVIDSAALSPEEADELQQLVNAARFFELPTSIGAPLRGAADYRQYTIGIEDGERSHTIQRRDPVEDPHLQALIRFLQAKARDIRRGELTRILWYRRRRRQTVPPPGGRGRKDLTAGPLSPYTRTRFLRR